MLSLAILFLVLALAGIVARKTYNYLPLPEMKRLAAKHDPLASKIYPAAAHGGSLRVLLGIWIVVTSAASFVLLARVAPLFLSLAAISLVLWAAFSWLPSSRVTSLGARFTLAITPPLIWLLERLYPLLSRLASVLQKRYRDTAHTGVFERQDLVQLLDRQLHQPDNRLTIEELDIAKRALSFDEHSVGDILTPRKHITTVQASDTLGPILIDELHKSGQNHVLVRETAKGPYVGTLDFKHLDLMHTGKVSDVMSPRIYYVHQQDKLGEALHAFFVTNCPVFVVVNSFEEYVGIITIESVLHQLLGHIPGDEFDQYADMTAVAARHPKVGTTDDEVVE